MLQLPLRDPQIQYVSNYSVTFLIRMPQPIRLSVVLRNQVTSRLRFRCLLQLEHCSACSLLDY